VHPGSPQHCFLVGGNSFNVSRQRRMHQGTRHRFCLPSNILLFRVRTLRLSKDHRHSLAAYIQSLTQTVWYTCIVAYFRSTSTLPRLVPSEAGCAGFDLQGNSFWAATWIAATKRCKLCNSKRCTAHFPPALYKQINACQASLQRKPTPKARDTVVSSSDSDEEGVATSPALKRRQQTVCSAHSLSL
jgi:hypothetical protein